MTMLSRRDFLIASAATLGSVVVSTGLSGCNSDNHNLSPLPYAVAFNHGVACGDPTPSALLLWTRVTADAPEVPVEWQISVDKNFNSILRSGSTTTSAISDYTLKIDVQDLTAGTVYYYRFRAGTVYSAVGRGKTLPTNNVNQLKFAVFSCANYPAGYFHVYGKAAQLNDLDASIHLGDYLYEYAVDGYASEDAGALGRSVTPEHELLTLTDYRARYAQYRSDTDLQLLHGAAPFIAVWDDHEIANDTWRDGAENHQADEGDFSLRKQAALQAYFEWMPIRPLNANDNETIYRQFVYGDLLNLLMLDTRVIGRDQQLQYSDYIDPVSGQLDAPRFSADLMQSNRTLLGSEQLQWLQDKISSSDSRWQMLGQQVLMGKMQLPGAVALQQLSITEFAELAQLAQLAQRAQAGDATLTGAELAYLQANQHKLTPQVIGLLQLPAMPYNLDAWDGYPVEREKLLASVLSHNKQLVVLAGDTHNAWANHLNLADGTPVAVELATSSVSSPGLEQYINLPDRITAAATEQALVQLVNGLQYANLYDRGFMQLTVTAAEIKCQWHYVDTIKQKTYSELPEREQQAKIYWQQDAATRLTLL